MPYSIIKEVKVRLWSKYDVHFVANNDVNILAGINGSGKTSLLPETNKLALVNINGKNLVVLIPSVDKSVISKNTKKKIRDEIIEVMHENGYTQGDLVKGEILW